MKKMLSLIVMLMMVISANAVIRTKVVNMVYEGAGGTTVYLADGARIPNFEAACGVRVNLHDVVEYDVSNGFISYFRNLSAEARQPGRVSYGPYGGGYYGGGSYGGGYGVSVRSKYGSINVNIPPKHKPKPRAPRPQRRHY